MRRRIFNVMLIIISSIIIIWGYYYLNKYYNFCIPCIFHKITGFYCPGCGATRCLLSLFRGNIVESYNYDTMLSAFLNCLDPDALKRLKDEAQRQGYFSITHTLHEIIMQRTDTTKADTIGAEVRELFDDVRISTGQKINDDTYYKRKQNRGNDYTTISQRKTYKADL